MTDEKDYYYRRAEAELEMAEKSEDPVVVAAHYMIAQTYIDRLGDALVADARAAGDGLKPVADNDPGGEAAA